MRWMLISVLFLSGCALLPEGLQGVLGTSRTDAAVAPETLQRPQARPDQNEVAPPAPEMSVGTLGRTIATLGNAAEPGLWLKTPLVDAVRQGRVFYPATDQSAEITLIPIEGPATAGSRMSLAAMQALGASPADLIEVVVFGF